MNSEREKVGWWWLISLENFSHIKIPSSNLKQKGIIKTREDPWRSSSLR